MPSRDLRDLADEDLMRIVRRGNADAFAVLYERHASSVFSLAYRMIGSRVPAEDIVQEAFLSAWRSSARYERDRGSVRSWLLGIVHHRAIDALRRGKVRGLGQVDGDAAADRVEAAQRTDAEVARREEAAAIRAAIEALPSEQARVIDLAYFGGFTHSEIAAMITVPVGTVKGRMRLGLKKLREELQQSALMPT